MQNAVSTIPDLLKAQALENTDSIAILKPDGEGITFGALALAVDALAATINAVVPKRADRPLRLGLALPNGPECMILQLAAMSLGTLVPFNSKGTFSEYETLFDACEIDCLLAMAGEESEAINAAQALDILPLRLTASLEIAGMKQAAPLPYAASPDEVAAIMLTSGSTGVPKLVPLTHRNLCRSASDVATSVSLTKDDLCLVMWEQFHIGGLVDLLLAPLSVGGCVLAGGSFNADSFFALSQRYEPTWFQVVPTTLRELVREKDRQTIEAVSPRLRFVRSVAAATSDGLITAAESAFGVPVVRTLGMTEAGPLITSTTLPPEQSSPGSVGQSAGTEIRILSDDGDQLGQNASGHIAIRGENVFDGYLGNDALNTQSFREGWFLTGDLGYLNERGELFLTGRKKDLINRGGEKISPAEIDEALAAHPDIELAASFAVAHDRLGEDVACAFTASKQLDPNEIRAFLSSRLSKFKVPGQIYQVASMPTNPVGKIDRYALAGIVGKLGHVQATPIPPRTQTEKIVGDIWAVELGVEHLGINQNFSALDGDSLSALRITVALEGVFGREMPEVIAEKFTTVEELSACLDQLGYVPDESRALYAQPDSVSDAHGERSVFDGDFANLAKSIQSAKTRSQLAIVLDHAFVHSTPSEIRDLQDEIRGIHVSDSAGFVAGLTLNHELRKWKGELQNALSRSSAEWSRNKISEFVLHYSVAAYQTSQKHLVVGFAGNRMRLLMPTFRVLSGLDPEKVDLLLLMDPEKKLFLDGIPDVPGALPGVAKFCREFADSNGYRGIIGLGTSGGSTAVFEAGLLADFERIVSVAPLDLDAHIGLTERLSDVRRSAPSSLRDIRIVHGKKEENRELACKLQRIFPEARTIRYPYARKGIFPAAEARGELNERLSDWLGLEVTVKEPGDSMS